MTRPVALLFPGQASQEVGMGVELRRVSQRARALFTLADTVTRLPITRLSEEGPIERLTATEVAQPAVVATSLAALAFLREQGLLPPVAVVAGHSVGELAAYVAADVLEEAEALRLVALRGRSMSDACARVDGTMAAVLHLDEEALRRACAEASGQDGEVQVANLNAPGQLVISGARVAIERAAERARKAGARRVLPLNVGGPFHSTYMRASAEALARALERVPFSPPRVPLIGNATAAVLQDERALREELSAQVVAPVRWIETLRAMAAMGVEQFLEVGPGRVLAGLVARTIPGARVVSFGSPSDADALRVLLSQEGAPAGAV